MTILPVLAWPVVEKIASMFFFDAFEVGLLPTEPLGGSGKKTNKCERLSFFSFCRIS
jgi:hypothetical protein